MDGCMHVCMYVCMYVVYMYNMVVQSLCLSCKTTRVHLESLIARQHEDDSG